MQASDGFKIGGSALALGGLVTGAALYAQVGNSHNNLLEKTADVVGGTVALGAGAVGGVAAYRGFKSADQINTSYKAMKENLKSSHYDSSLLGELATHARV